MAKKKKITKFTKKTFDDGKEYLCCRVNGDWTRKELKSIKDYLNRACQHYLNPPIESVKPPEEKTQEE